MSVINPKYEIARRKLNDLFNSPSSALSIGVPLGDLLYQVIQDTIDDTIETADDVVLIVQEYITNNPEIITDIVEDYLAANPSNYTPSNPSDWIEVTNAVPTNSNQALDQLVFGVKDRTKTPSEIMVVLNQTNLDNKKIILPSTPLFPNLVNFLPLNGIIQENGIDFEVIGDEIRWDGKGLDNFLELNEKIIIKF